MLFIIIHQTKELWLKQMIRELRLAQTDIRNDALIPAYKALARVSRIQAVMTLSWDVLSTMTPSDYTRFRHVLGPSSGFQSDQFRTVEYLLGLKDPGFLKYQDDRPEARAAMAEVPELDIFIVDRRHLGRGSSYCIYPATTHWLFF